MKKLFTILALAGGVAAMAQTTVKWNGASSADWDLVSSNWLPIVGLPFPTNFNAGDNVVIGNERLDGADTLKVIGDIAVGNINVNNNADYTYTILTDGVVGTKLSGTGILTKEGVGELRMNALNELTGGTVLKEGVLKQLTANVNVFGPKVTLEGGQMWFPKGSTSPYTATNTRITVPAEKSGELYSGQYHYLDSSIVGSGTLNIVANGERVFLRFAKGATASEFTGQINVYRYGNPYNGGAVNPYNAAAGKGFGLGLGLTTNNTWDAVEGTGITSELKNAKVHLGFGGSLYCESGTRCYEIGELTAANDSSYLLGYYKSSTSPIVYWQIGGLNTDVVFPGTIRPAATATDGKPRTDNKVGVIKVGTGTYRFTSGKNYITMGLEIKEGAVMINNPDDSESGTGYHTTKGTVVFVRPNAVLGGTGRISGHVDVEGKLMPGDNNMDSLTIGDLKSAYDNFASRRKLALILRPTATVEMEISSSAVHDLIVADSIKYDGNLVVKLASSYALAPDDTVQLFKAHLAMALPTQFASVELPKTAEGWVWDTSNLYKYGSIKLVSGGGTVAKVDSNLNKFVSIYPNPSNGAFKVAVTNGKGLQVDVFNASGALVASKPIVSGSEASIDLGSGKGIYMVKIATTEGAVVRKIIVR